MSNPMEKEFRNLGVWRKKYESGTLTEDDSGNMVDHIDGVQALVRKLKREKKAQIRSMESALKAVHAGIGTDGARANLSLLASFLQEAIRRAKAEG